MTAATSRSSARRGAMDRLPNEVALITGVSRKQGLGFAVARELAQRGFEVIVTARTLTDAQYIADLLQGQSLKVAGMQLDVTSNESVHACQEAVAARHGRLNALINNAAGGFDIDQTVLTADLDRAQLALDVNFLGPWRTTQAFAHLLHQSGRGCVVNVSSASGSLTSAEGLTNPHIGGLIPGYSLSKSALNALTIKLAAAFAASGVMVNAVCPGETATHPETGDEQGARSPEDSAHGVVWAATLKLGGPSGRFFRDGVELPW
ncbi:NAD(P)-dependent dehydrogenase (short-subunit alcohol dehydrogenase family) [Mycobacterium frederiksbergense]|uniref:NAD(P)-dependent dehydrogenase (Short-subunit alcohol dehydrogenase family) n=1 Tax=Mycolicibacterium frederiksbergense TaxID=117567 RepID=A0ABT6KVT1_9MYCO|nr:SDR family NAD(P)-dependent oxidoreductase [Mycolicibacterium frederiksbergense]MDH6194080.1 NAD(P)-dependent dehydrogenase (short-subunit alcohol dehydrogenase family) [Mycolicibacterium frederiksbergense]